MIDMIKPFPAAAYSPTQRKPIDKEHFEEWVRSQAGCARCLTPEEWTHYEFECREKVLGEKFNSANC